MSKVRAAPVALEKEVGKPKVSTCRFLPSLLKESVQGRVKLRQELAGSRAEMKGNRMSPEDVIIFWSTRERGDVARLLDLLCLRWKASVRF